MSTKGNRTAVYLAAAAVFMALFGNLVNWRVSEGEREELRRVDKANAALSAKTNEGLICLLQRATATVRANPGNRTPEQVELTVSYYNREIQLLGGRRKCDTERVIDP